MEKVKETTLSKKCQITVPKRVRDILGVDAGDNIAFYIENGNIKLTTPENLKIELIDKNKKAIVGKGEKKWEVLKKR